MVEGTLSDMVKAALCDIIKNSDKDALDLIKHTLSVAT